MVKTYVKTYALRRPLGRPNGLQRGAGSVQGCGVEALAASDDITLGYFVLV